MINDVAEFALHHFNNMAGKTLTNYVSPGLESALLDKGKTRMFRNTRRQLHMIQPHSHRFDFVCYVLRGWVENTLWAPCDWRTDSMFVARTLEYIGQPGSFMRHNDSEPKNFSYVNHRYKAGEWYGMKADEIHSITFSDQAVVLFFEGPQLSDTSVVLMPVVDGKVIEMMDTPSWMFQPKQEQQ